MRKARIYYKDEEAGILTQFDDGSFEFSYTDVWVEEETKSSISLTMPKNQQVYKSPYLFPFFYNMLPEGTNKEIFCFQMRIDKDDHFGILMNTARYDTIGAVRLEKMEEE